MPKRTKYHVLKHPEGWKVKKEGAKKASATSNTKEEAVGRAKDLAKANSLSQVVIHKIDGTIQTEHTYGEDPKRSKG